LKKNKASGTQLIQELREAGVSAVTRYKPEGDKIMRLNAQTGAMEGGFVHLPREAHWLADYLHELAERPLPRCSASEISTPSRKWSSSGRRPASHMCTQ
jgi:predicted phage terminase large subunit-like protein